MTSLSLLDNATFTHANLIYLSYLLAEQFCILLPKQKQRWRHLEKIFLMQRSRLSSKLAFLY